MAYDPLDPNVPSGTDPANTIDDIIRRYEAQVAERMNDITGNPPLNDGWENAEGTDDEPNDEFLLRLKSSAVDDATKRNETDNTLITRYDNWVLGGVATSNTPYSMLFPDAFPGTTGVAASATQGNAIVTWRMPMAIPSGNTIQNYKAQLQFLGSSPGSAELSLYGFAGFGTIVQIGSTVTVTGQAGAQVLELAPGNDLNTLILLGFAYWAEILLTNGQTGNDVTLLFSSGPVYESPGASVRF